jgi:hypothetical protein
MSDALRQLLADWAVPPDGMVGKLPRVTCRKCSDAPGKCCQDHSKRTCVECGNYITEKHIHLDYLGHAAVTRALIEADPEWQWEPVAFDEKGAPLVVVNGNTAELWIRLSVLGVTRLGVGTCDSRKADAATELFGDGWRNAAMRFGVALSLWSKEEWEGETHEPAPVMVSRHQANNRVLHHLAENGFDKDAATAKAAVLMSSVRGDGPFPEADLADVFARAAATMPEALQ